MTDLVVLLNQNRELVKQYTTEIAGRELRTAGREFRTAGKEIRSEGRGIGIRRLGNQNPS